MLSPAGRAQTVSTWKAQSLMANATRTRYLAVDRLNDRTLTLIKEL
jgi:hypothetical protein